MPAPVVGGEGVRLVDDDRPHATEEAVRVDPGGEEHRLQRLRRREQDVGRVDDEALSLRRADVAVPEPDPGADVAPVRLEPGVEVVEQGPERTQVQRAEGAPALRTGSRRPRYSERPARSGHPQPRSARAWNSGPENGWYPVGHGAESRPSKRMTPGGDQGWASRRLRRTDRAASHGAAPGARHPVTHRGTRRGDLARQQHAEARRRGRAATADAGDRQAGLLAGGETVGGCHGRTCPGRVRLCNRRRDAVVPRLPLKELDLGSETTLDPVRSPAAVAGGAAIIVTDGGVGDPPPSRGLSTVSRCAGGLRAPAHDNPATPPLLSRAWRVPAVAGAGGEAVAAPHVRAAARVAAQAGRHRVGVVVLGEGA